MLNGVNRNNTTWTARAAMPLSGIEPEVYIIVIVQRS